MAQKEVVDLIGYLIQNAMKKYEDWLVVKFIYDSLVEDQDSNKYYEKAICCLASKFGVLQAGDYARTQFERTLQIQIAAWHGDVEVVQDLVVKCDKPNTPDHNGRTPLGTAAEFGHADIVKLLAPFEKNPNAPNINGYTPIQVATKKGHVEVVKILAPLSENPNSPDPEGWTPIQLASHCNKNAKEIIQILAPISKYPNAPDNNGWTPIQHAAKRDHTGIVRVLAPLTKKGNTKDPEGKTPIERAFERYNDKIIKILDPSHPIPKLPKLEVLEEINKYPKAYMDVVYPDWENRPVIKKQKILIKEIKYSGLLGKLKNLEKTPPPLQEEKVEDAMFDENDSDQEIDLHSKWFKIDKEIKYTYSGLLEKLKNLDKAPPLQEEKVEDEMFDENDSDQEIDLHSKLVNSDNDSQLESKK